jgi:oligoribonuclease
MSRLVFLDFETTGLEVANGAEPIEVAAVVTDDAFRELDSFETLIVPSFTSWDPTAYEMHQRSGLFDLCRTGISRERAGAALALFLAPFASETLHLAGNSVHFDRSVLAHYWPDFERQLHHRHLDVSSVRMFGQRFTSAPPMPGPVPHRAMADVRRAIAELHYWHAALRCGPTTDSLRLAC